MTAVLKHELRAYFHSLTAYVFGAFLLAFVGIGAMMYNLQAAVSNFEYVLSFGCLVFVVIVPILTMRVIAEERKQKTDQLLYSLPITTTQVVIGKYLALLTVYLIPLCIICIYPLIFSQFGDVYTIASEKKGNDRTYFYGEEELDIAMFQSALEGLVAESFTSEQPSQQEEIGLTVYLDNENHPEVQIKLYRYDGSHCLAVVDGAPVSLVTRTSAVDLIEAVHAIVLD